MGMGYGANYADVIESNDVANVCEITWKKLEAALKSDDMSLEDFAHLLYFNDVDEDSDTYLAYLSLQKAFNHFTGLDLYLGFHDKEECGDRYDQINGYYWNVDGMYELTEAGKKMESVVDRKFFVTFG